MMITVTQVPTVTQGTHHVPEPRDRKRLETLEATHLGMTTAGVEPREVIKAETTGIKAKTTRNERQRTQHAFRLSRHLMSPWTVLEIKSQMSPLAQRHQPLSPRRDRRSTVRGVAKRCGANGTALEQRWLRG